VLLVLLVLDQPVLVAGAPARPRRAPPCVPGPGRVGRGDGGRPTRDLAPPLAVVDLDLVPSECLAGWGATTPPPGERVPVIALTQPGGLPATLAAFDRGVEDVLSVPFAPEELVARMLAVLQRTSRTMSGRSRCCSSASSRSICSTAASGPA
jgi:DNA-binding response OmpR family regulator